MNQTILIPEQKNLFKNQYKRYKLSLDSNQGFIRSLLIQMPLIYK